MKVWFFSQYEISKMCIFNINQSISYNNFQINNYKYIYIYITFAITIFIIKMVLNITRIVICPACFWFYLVLGISCSQDQNFAWGRGFFTWGEGPHITKPNVLINLTYTLIEWEWALQTNFWDWVQERTFVCVKYM